MTDDELQDWVREELFWDPRVDSAAIAVSANDGRSETAFAQLCGTAPFPVSSGRTDRHRLNRGGDRRANHAWWRIALVPMPCHPPTRA